MENLMVFYFFIIFEHLVKYFRIGIHMYPYKTNGREFCINRSHVRINNRETQSCSQRGTYHVVHSPAIIYANTI